MELPPRLERRFGFYLNFLRIAEKVGLYGSLSIGLLLSVYAVSRVAHNASKSYASQQYKNSSVYNPCEVSKLSRQNEASMPNNDYEDGARECLNIIRRENDYELENDDALSDIEYNETNDEEESTASSSEQVCKFTHLLSPRRRFCACYFTV